MRLKAVAGELSVCKLPYDHDLKDKEGFFFWSKTEREASLVCPSEAVPAAAEAVESGWRGFYIEGSLDFSLVGVVSALTAVLAEEKIPVFVISTFDTDYFLVKEEYLARAAAALSAKGYETEL